MSVQKTPSTSASAPINFSLDGFITPVSLDTVTPANSRPLPVELINPGGAEDSYNTGNADAGTQRVVLASNQPVVAVSGPLTDTELRATAVPVSGTFWQATQPVSGPFLTDAELRASAVTVSGPLTDTQLRASSVPVSGPFLTNAELRAAAVPVSGTFWQVTQPVSGPLTDTELRASAVPVSAASLPLPAGAATEATLSAQSAKLPATLGQKTKANSMAVVLASDSDSLPVSFTEARPSAASVTSVSSSASNVTLLSSNASRVMATFFNESTQICYLKLGTTASATSYTVQMFPGDFFEVPRPTYTGQIDAIWASANGSMRITEL